MTKDIAAVVSERVEEHRVVRSTQVDFISKQSLSAGSLNARVSVPGTAARPRAQPPSSSTVRRRPAYKPPQLTGAKRPLLTDAAANRESAEQQQQPPELAAASPQISELSESERDDVSVVSSRGNGTPFPRHGLISDAGGRRRRQASSPLYASEYSEARTPTLSERELELFGPETPEPQLPNAGTPAPEDNIDFPSPSLSSGPSEAPSLIILSPQ